MKGSSEVEYKLKKKKHKNLLFNFDSIKKKTAPPILR